MDGPGIAAARGAYRDCAWGAAKDMSSSKEPARDVALTAVNVCRPKALALSDAVVEHNPEHPYRRVSGDALANAYRGRLMEEIAASVMKARSQ